MSVSKSVTLMKRMTHKIILTCTIFALYIFFIHILYFCQQCNLYIISLPPPQYMFRPYTAIIRCVYLLQLFPCVVCAA
jgi:hypothetical protein